MTKEKTKNMLFKNDSILIETIIPEDKGGQNEENIMYILISHIIINHIM
jgi:hypothetical protein